MNKIKITLCAMCALFVTTLSAQELKFGHINLQEVIPLMSEMDSANVKIQKYVSNLEETLKGMQSEFQNKYVEYQQKGASWTTSIRTSKEQELQGLEQRIAGFQQNAQQELEQIKQMVLAPIFRKAQDELTKLGKAKGLIYIFDISQGSTPYVDETKSLNLAADLKVALGIPADKKLPQQQQQLAK